jgi:hypothetical protein
MRYGLDNAGWRRAALYRPGGALPTGKLSRSYDTGVPAAAGHYNVGASAFGPELAGEFQIQVIQVR